MSEVSKLGENPLRIWRLKSKLTHEEVSAMVAALGGKMGARTCEAYEIGLRSPAWKLCKILVKVSGGAFTASELKDWHLAAESDKKQSAA